MQNWAQLFFFPHAGAVRHHLRADTCSCHAVMEIRYHNLAKQVTYHNMHHMTHLHHIAYVDKTYMLYCTMCLVLIRGVAIGTVIPAVLALPFRKLGTVDKLTLGQSNSLKKVGALTHVRINIYAVTVLNVTHEPLSGPTNEG